MKCKSGWTYVRQKIFKMDSLNLKLIFQKNRLLNKLIPKNQVNRRNIFTGKMHCFLKVLTTFYKEIREIINLIVMRKIQHVYPKSSNLLMQTQPAVTCSKLTIETLAQGVKYVQS